LPARKGLLDRTRKLSQRERQVTELVAQGMKNREIANLPGIQVHVVRNYLSSVYDKIGVNNRLELALWYEARRYEDKFPLTAIGDRTASAHSVGNLPIK
jgi:DNA-binding NarL/FixJ family response regulator